jgi:hypothetical protein
LTLVFLKTISFQLKITSQINKYKKDSNTKNRYKQQKTVITMSLILIGFYLITWTPYAIAALYSVFLKYFSNLPSISPILATMHYIVMHYIVMHYIVMHYIVMHYIVMSA